MSAATRSQDAGPAWKPFYKDSASADTLAAALSVTNAPADTVNGVIKVDDIFITSEVAQNILVQDNTGTPVVLFGPLYVAAGGLLAITLRNGLAPASKGKTVQVKGTVAGNVKVHCSWHEINTIA